MKRLVLGLAAAAVLVTSASAVSFSWISSKLGGDGTLPSFKNEVSAHGWDFRSYTYADPAGRICTVVFTDQKGGTIDCDFPPADFDMEAFIKKMKK